MTPTIPLHKRIPMLPDNAIRYVVCAEIQVGIEWVRFSSQTLFAPVKAVKVARHMLTLTKGDTVSICDHKGRIVAWVEGENANVTLFDGADLDLANALAAR